MDMVAEPPGAGGWQRYYLHLSSFPAPPLLPRQAEKPRDQALEKPPPALLLLLGVRGDQQDPPAKPPRRVAPQSPSLLRPSRAQGGPGTRQGGRGEAERVGISGDCREQGTPALGGLSIRVDPSTAAENGMELPWGTKGQGEAAGDARSRRQEHPSGWSRGAGREGDPRVAQDGGPVGVELPLREGAARDARLQQVPGSRRGPCAAIPELFVCLPARHAPSSRSQPLRRAPASLLAVCRRLWKPGFSPEPRGAAPTAAPAPRALHRPLRGGAGGKQAAAAWLLIHHLQPPRGSARNASSRERWGRGEQGPPAPARCDKMELWRWERRPERGQLVTAAGTGMEGGVWQGEGSCPMFPKQGGRCPCGTEGTFAGRPELCFAFGGGSPDTSLGGPPAAQPPVAPQKKASSRLEALWESASA